MSFVPRSAGFPTCLLIAALSACAPERTRAIKATAEEVETGDKDYRAMLKQARTRRTSDTVISEITQGLDRFRTERGRLPTNLMELVQSGVLRTIPTAPAGLAFAYDARSGNIRLMPIDEHGQIAVPEDTFEAPSLIKSKSP